MFGRPVLRFFASLLLLTLIAASCSTPSDEPTALAMIASAPLPEPTALPTTAPLSIPTATPLPTATSEPTATPEPSATPIPAATAVPTPVPVLPTATPEPTTLPIATATAVPVPTATTEPTPAPEPTPEPTATPAPEQAPTAEPGTGGGDVEAEGPPAQHVVSNVGYVTLGKAGEAWLSIPAALVELIGFHEASHPGSQAINAAGTGIEMMVLDSRGRGTSSHSAADIVVPPGEPLRSPVTGTVVASKTYVLYCEHQDKLVYIEPDGLPGWQVRVFHVAGETPAIGTRVIAGETVIATGGANPLPFESQIDKFTAEPSWPHAHVEVVDTSVPDTRPPGGGC